MRIPREILIVDDDEDDIFFFRLAAQQVLKGVYCHSLVQPEKTVSLLLDKPNIEIVFLDLLMPRVELFHTLSAIKGHASLKHLHVTIYTSMMHYKKEALERGADGFLLKQSSPELIKRSLADFFEQW